MIHTIGRIASRAVARGSRPRISVGFRYNVQVRLDFHVHTTVSDGHFTPEGLLELALRADLGLLAITDHDAIEGHDRAVVRLAERRAAARVDEGWAGPRLKLVPGVEFSTSFERDEVHILGYFPAGVPAGLRDFLRDAEAARLGRIVEAVGTLTRLGYPIKVEEVQRHSPGRAIGRSHLARAMVDVGIAVTTADAFRRFLATERGVVPPSRNRAADVVRLIREHGGMAALAHPPVDRVDEIVRALAPVGLEGIELYGKTRRAVDQLYFETVAREYGLIGTGGTDWHGHAKVPSYEGISIGADKIGPFLERLGIQPE